MFGFLQTCCHCVSSCYYWSTTCCHCMVKCWFLKPDEQDGRKRVVLLLMLGLAEIAGPLAMITSGSKFGNILSGPLGTPYLLMLVLGATVVSITLHQLRLKPEQYQKPKLCMALVAALLNAYIFCTASGLAGMCMLLGSLFNIFGFLIGSLVTGSGFLIGKTVCLILSPIVKLIGDVYPTSLTIGCGALTYGISKGLTSLLGGTSDGLNYILDGLYPERNWKLVRIQAKKLNNIKSSNFLNEVKTQLLVRCRANYTYRRYCWELFPHIRAYKNDLLLYPFKKCSF